MAIRDILIIPEKKLRLVSEPIKAVDKPLRALVDDMFETMYEAPGIGLAAIQIGEPVRLITMDVAKKDDPKEPRVFINPEIIWSSEEISAYEEGCLSIPEYYEEVARPASVKVKYLDLDGKEQELEADGLLATCIQHEIDHLNGVLFIDHISKLKRAMVMKKFTKAARKASARRWPRTKSRRIISGERRRRAFDCIGACLRLIFMGTPDFAVPSLVALHAAGHEIVAVYTREAKPGGRRGLDLVPTPVERQARAHGLPVLTPKTLRNDDALAEFNAFEADAAVVVAYGMILPKAILDAPRLGCFNVHASLLPRWRGAAPINRAIMAGDKECGVTIMQMDEGLDTGAMAIREPLPIGPT